MFTKSGVLLVYYIAWLSIIFAQGTREECSSNSDCIYKRYCCKRRGSWSVCQASCVNLTCYSDTDCGGPHECCDSRERRCVAGTRCDECWSNTQCPSGQYCCRRSLSRLGSVCLSECFNQSCNSNAECGAPAECCSRERRCTRSCFHQCHHNRDCEYGKYCCTSSTKGNRCAPDCVGQVCITDKQCGAPKECCSMNGHCTRSCPDECHSNAGCKIGTYCCNKRFSHENSICKTSCVNETCQLSSDCGGPGEKCCVVARRCSTTTCDECLSNIDCYRGLYCCRRLRQHNLCLASCLGESCYWNKDCGAPKECCSGSSRQCTTSCMNVEGCSSNSQCTAPNYCCKKGYQAGECKPNCLSEICRTDDDCGGPKECCDSNNRCAHCCASGIAPWIIVFIIICAVVVVIVPVTITIWCCFKKRTTARFRRTGTSAPQLDQAMIPLQPIPPEPPQYSQTPTHPNGPPPPYNSSEGPLC